jgi:PEP-CTERM motif
VDKRLPFLPSLASMALVALTASQANAAFVVTFTEEGQNVEESGSGTINLTDLSFVETLPGAETQAALTPSLPGFVSGISDTTAIYGGDISGPTTWGSGAITGASSSFGDVVGLDRARAFLLVPDGYSSGFELSTNATYAGASFTSLGVTPGSYVYHWGSGADADTLTVEIGSAGSPVPEPATWAMMLAGFAGLGLLSYRASCSAGRIAA